MKRSMSRLFVESAIALGIVSVVAGIALKLLAMTGQFSYRGLGLTPGDFLAFASVCFLSAMALTGRALMRRVDAIGHRTVRRAIFH